MRSVSFAGCRVPESGSHRVSAAGSTEAKSAAANSSATGAAPGASAFLFARKATLPANAPRTSTPTVTPTARRRVGQRAISESLSRTNRFEGRWPAGADPSPSRALDAPSARAGFEKCASLGWPRHPDKFDPTKRRPAPWRRPNPATSCDESRRRTLRPGQRIDSLPLPENNCGFYAALLPVSLFTR